MAVQEDLNDGTDITTAACVPEELEGELRIVARRGGVLCGACLLPTIIEAFRSGVELEPSADDGEMVAPGTTVAVLRGKVAELLTLERTVLNFVARLSGIASLTHEFVTAVAGTRAKIFDTRKTTPGWRVLEKYAVRAGGGCNHRMGLYDAVLVKDNHRLAWQRSGGTDLGTLVRKVRQTVGPQVFVEVEVDSFEEFEAVISSPLDAVLLDNFAVELLRRAVRLRDEVAPGVILEASGGITLETVRAVAATGVERISSGALTHAFCWLDLSAELVC